MQEITLSQVKLYEDRLVVLDEDANDLVIQVKQSLKKMPITSMKYYF